MGPKRKSLSHRQVTCGECSASLSRRELLQPHFNSQHKGRAAFEKNQQKLNFNSNKRARTSSPELSVSPDRPSIDKNISLTSAPKFQSPDRPSPSQPCSISPSTTSVSSHPQSDQSESSEAIILQLKTLLGKLELQVCSGQPSTPIAIQSAEAPSPTQSISQNSPPRATKLRDKTVSQTKTLDEVDLLSQCTCLKHILALLDDFETHIICMLCFDPIRPLYGQFDITDVEYEKLSKRSQQFRNLSKLLKKHVQLETHLQKSHGKKDSNSEKGTQRNRDLGRRLGTLSYFIYYNNLPFSTFEKFMPWFSLNNIDMGKINHSVAFVTNFLKSVSDVLRKRLRNNLDTP